MLVKHNTCKIATTVHHGVNLSLKQWGIVRNSQARRGGDHGIPCPEISTAILLCLWNMEDLILNTRHGLAFTEFFMAYSKLSIILKLMY